MLVLAITSRLTTELMSTDKYLFQLKSLDPAVRREAITALGKAGEARALQPLEQLSTSDPDPDVRSLAVEVCRELEDLQWKQFAEPAASAPEKPAPPSLTVQQPYVQVSSYKRRLAKGYLSHAFTFHSAGDEVNALAHLANTLKSDPNIANDKVARNLAANLMNQPEYPEQAMAMVLQLIKENKIVYPRQPLLDAAGRRTVAILLVGAVLLYLALVVFAATFTWNLQGGTSVAASDLLNLLAVIFKPAVVSKQIPFAAGLFIMLLFGDISMYYVGAVLGGVGSLLRFVAGMVVAQAIVYLVVGFGIVLFPVFTFVPLGNGTVAAKINIMLLALGGLWAFGFQAFFAARAHRSPLQNGLLMVLAGTAIGSLLGGLIGAFKTFGIG